MSEIFSRNEMLFGKDKLEILSKRCVAVVGLGGVGGYTLEALARIGIQNFKIVDFDTVEKSNINRQIIAFNSTVGQNKTDIFEKRLKDINPDIKIEKFTEFYTKDLNENLFKNVDFVVDAIDTMRYKIELLENCYSLKIPVISAFGAGNRIDPTKLKIADISEIKKGNDQFTKNILYQLKKREITQGIMAVYSEEKPIKLEIKSTSELPDGSTKIGVGSCVFVVATMGYYIAYEVVNQLLK